jgi:leader peptidase (prepilin peptidase)/N-methyltransferase
MGVVVVLLGLAIGSFLNVCIDRLPDGQSIVRPRSHCPTCKTVLAARDLVPVLSYLLLRGRCRYCSAPIPPRVLLVEAGTGPLFLLLWSRYGMSLHFAFVALVACVFIVVLVIDFEHRLIPNQVIYPAIGVAFVATPLVTGVVLPQVLWGGAIGLALLSLIVLVYPQGIGLGDVKLAAFIGLVAGFPLVLLALFLSFVLGGGVGAAALLGRRIGMKDALPFAPFLAVGGMIALLYGEEILRWYPGLTMS